jgi:hypothetical protein
MKYISLFLVSLFLSACATPTALFQTTYPNKPTHVFKDNVVFGESDPIGYDAASVCKGAGNISKISSEQTAADLFYTYVTLTMYSPKHIAVYC